MELRRILGYLCLATGLASISLSASTTQLLEKPKELHTARFLLYQNGKDYSPYSVRFKGRNFVVHPEVFSPKYFPDSFWFAERVRVQPGDSFLEIGSGTGLISVMAAINGAGKVTTVDINPAAVKNTAENVFLHHVSQKFKILEGDVFDPITKGERFDVIFWFAPFMHIDIERENLTRLEMAVFDPNYQSLKKFLSQGRDYLRPHGKLLLGFSPTHGDYEVLEELAKENGWKLKVVDREEEQIPLLPGVDQADSITVMLIELVPNRGDSRN